MGDYAGLHRRLVGLVAILRDLGYEFANPKEVLPGPHKDVERQVQRVEKLVGPLPEALRDFYRTVGSIDLRGRHPAWSGCDYPDPLVVEPVQNVLEEAEEYAELEDPREEYWASETGVFRAPIAPDALHKADVSGGMWYGVEVPNPLADPIVLEEAHALPFTAYLAFALQWGGFPGLEHAGSHTWPLEALRSERAG